METTRKVNVELGNLILKIYNKIATWNNKDYPTPEEKGTALKELSLEIATLTIEDALTQFDLKGGVEEANEEITEK